ncbi:MAG: hypothetical protein QXZ68_01035 [Candidatus Bathyarchaeia archaeon]
MSAQNPPRGFVFRWNSALRSFAALILFTFLAAIVEYLTVVYAISIGVEDEACLQISWLGLTVSPLFHLVPASTVMVLVASWTCMAKYFAVKPVEKAKPAQKKPKTSSKGLKAGVSGFLERLKFRLMRVKGLAYIWDKLSLGRAAVKSAILLLLGFSALALLVSVMASPWLIYRGFVSLYQGNPQLLDFVKAFSSALGSFAKTIAPVGWVCLSMDSALRSAAPGVRNFALSLGALIKPLADLPPAVKYLFFQNLAAWISAMAVLVYGAYTRKSYRHKKVKKF